MNIKMIVTDLDDTLLSGKKEITEYTLTIIRKCQELGIKFVPATARPLSKIEPLGISADALITLNGSRIYQAGEQIYHKGISKKELNAFLPTFLKKYNTCRISVDMDDFFYTNHDLSEIEPKLTNFKIHDLMTLPDKIIDRILLTLPQPSEIKNLQEILPDYLHAHLFRDQSFCRILHKDVSKAAAISHLCEKWQIDPSEVVAFGDDYNDIEMFKLCGQGVAVENAIAELKAVATDTTCCNNTDGVAKWLEQNVLK